MWREISTHTWTVDLIENQRYKNGTHRIDPIQSDHHHHRNVTCYYHDIQNAHLTAISHFMFSCSRRISEIVLIGYVQSQMI